MKFTKKPVTIEAIQVLDFSPAHATIKTAEAQTPWFAEALSKHGSEAGAIHFVGDMLGINTLEGTHWVTRGDFIIRGVKGELYPCKPDIFALTYEAERTTSPVSQMTAHLAAIEEALKVMRDNGLDECYAFENAIEALAFMKEVAK